MLLCNGLGLDVGLFLIDTLPMFGLQYALSVLGLAEDLDPEVEKAVGVIDGRGDGLGRISQPAPAAGTVGVRASMLLFAFERDETTPSMTAFTCWTPWSSARKASSRGSLAGVLFELAKARDCRGGFVLYSLSSSMSMVVRLSEAVCRIELMVMLSRRQ